MRLTVQTGDPGLFPYFFAGIGGLALLAMAYVFVANPRGRGDRIVQLWVNMSPFRSRMLISPGSLARMLGVGYLIAGLVLEAVAVTGVVTRY